MSHDVDEGEFPCSPLSGYHSDSLTLNDSAILDEDSGYEPGEEEVKEYAQFLGMDLDQHADLLWIAREGLKAPLPPPWKPCKTKEDPPRMYYFNFETGESSWEYPCDKQYKELFLKELEKKENKKGVAIKLFCDNVSKSPPPQVEVSNESTPQKSKKNETTEKPAENIVANNVEQNAKESNKSARKESDKTPKETTQKSENSEKEISEQAKVSPVDKTNGRKLSEKKQTTPAEKVQALRAETQVAVLEHKLREARAEHATTVAELAAEIARLADDLAAAESKCSEVVAELAAKAEFKEKLAATARSDAAAKASVAAANRERDDALAELAQLRQLTSDAREKSTPNERSVDSEKLRERLGAHDEEWNAKLSSVKGMVQQIKDYLESNGANEHSKLSSAP